MKKFAIHFTLTEIFMLGFKFLYYGQSEHFCIIDNKKYPSGYFIYGWEFNILGFSFSHCFKKMKFPFIKFNCKGIYKSKN